MKRFWILILACLLALSGCGQPASTTATPTTATLAPTTTQAEENTEVTWMDAMIERSLISKGNNNRLKALLDKIRNGEKVTVGFIGGSITEGYMAGTTDTYVKLVTEYLDNTYGGGKGNVTYVNAGLSGTPSMLGLIRSQDDLLFAQPDLIFIEFAVNDAQSITDRQAYESLVRRCLQQENAPAVILLYSMTETGYTCQDNMNLTAFYYGLPAISVKNAISPALESGEMTWADWSSDDVHPNASGHRLYAQFITTLIGTLDKAEADTPVSIPKRCQAGKDWTDLVALDHTNLNPVSLGGFRESTAHHHFQRTYSYRGGDNSGLTFTFTGDTLFLVFKATTAQTYGTAEVLVDGEVVAHLGACRSDGWNNPVTQLIFSEKEAAEHTVTIRMQPGDEEKDFDLLTVGIA